MKIAQHALIGLALAAGIVSCSEDNPWVSDAGTGGLKLHLRANSEVTDAKPQTRATLDLPSTEDFSVKLEKIDGSYSKTWAILSDFDAETSFPTGSYTLTAFYGNAESEGFDAPYFEGTTQLTVLEQRLTEAEITATLANTMVSIDYTDAFKKYFSDYKTTIHSEGHSYVEVPKEETRAAFVAPGEVDLTVEFTKPNGQSAKVQPASFAALARHHYHITFDVNGGNVGEAQLTVIFDDTLTEENVTIDLTEELFTSAPPRIKPNGFTSGDELELLSYTAPENPLKFTIIAHGGLEEAMLTIASSSYTPAFGKEINLIVATDLQKQQIAAAGINVLGLYKNPDQMASVDITGLIGKLPAGDYEISMMAKDRYTRVSDPVSIKFTSVPLELTATAQIGLFGVSQGLIDIAYNGSNPREDVTFKAMNRNGVYVDAPVTDCQETTRTRSIPVRNYTMTISLPDVERKQIPVKVYLKGNEVAQLNIAFAEPEYEIAVDAYATRSVLMVKADADNRKAITKALKIFVGGKETEPAKRDLEQGLIYLTGLTPATEYSDVKVSLTNSPEEGKTISFTTEVATDIPNGDFSKTHETINMTNIMVGGSYKVGLITYTSHSSIVINEAEGWASINPKTCWSGANNKNTWFCVPSTWAVNGQVKVRSVGYDHNGTTPATTGKFTSTTYYNPTAATLGSKSSGELFLGTYSYNGSESRTNQIAFSSRPSSVSFDYSYSPYNNDTGVALVELRDALGNVISTSSVDLGVSNSMKTVTIPLTYKFGVKASSLTINFKSSKGNFSINIPSGAALNENAGLTINHTIDANAYKTYASGSELTLDNVKLNY
ncbi:MAG: DUF4493 domain-containing protein [Clostridium sp.]|nr:DUF4493 domain-containing protein [Prevotella sp.]MCM1428295.1 DUF4493 domain-containing protein [Clostridium sp.]MCM1474767.1 DUF4493 domain-containing protein [Muribaculaceae bacterium]